MVVPTEAEAETRRMLAQSAALSGGPAPIESPLSEFAVYDDEGDEDEELDPSQIWVTDPQPAGQTATPAPEGPLSPPPFVVPPVSAPPALVPATQDDSQAKLPTVPPPKHSSKRPPVASPPLGSTSAPPLPAGEKKEQSFPPTAPASQPSYAFPPAQPPQLTSTEIETTAVASSPSPAAVSTSSPSPVQTRAATMVSRQIAARRASEGWLLVSRNAVFLQGGIIFLVAIGAFVAGWFMGGGARVSDSNGGGKNQAEDTVLIQGTLTYESSEGGVQSDGGAVVIAWPQGAMANPRIDPQSLHPAQPAPADGSHVMLAMEEAGVKYARVAPDGAYHLVLPRRGDYYLLFISSHAARPLNQAVAESDMEVVRRLFSPPTSLIGRQKYRLVRDTLDEGLEMRPHDFGRSGM